jgi:hypothetical protein
VRQDDTVLVLRGIGMSANGCDEFCQRTVVMLDDSGGE